MTDIQILTWAIGGGFVGTWIVMGIAFKLLRDDIVGLRQDLVLLREEVRDIDRRLCRIEGAMTNKDCCMLKHDHGGVAK